jgi:hypothetical protein
MHEINAPHQRTRRGWAGLRGRMAAAFVVLLVGALVVTLGVIRARHESVPSRALVRPPAASPSVSQSAPSSSPVASPSRSQPTPGVGLPRSVPVSVWIPKINARSSLVGLGLNANGSLQTPPVSTPMQAGWYDLGPARVNADRR